MPSKGGDHLPLLNKREDFWIFLPETRIPRGLNDEWDYFY